jgi:hypothetical protein
MLAGTPPDYSSGCHSCRQAPHGRDRRVFQASSAMRAFCAAVSAVKGGSGGRLILRSSFGGFGRPPPAAR